jgi:hypothetical protein
LWHSFTRSATVDTYLNTLHGAIISGESVENWPTVRQHIDHSVRLVIAAENNLMPGELGWFGIWPKGKNTDGLQLDETEYLMAKSLAYDTPISLQTSFGQMANHPLTAGILEIVRAYEELRAGGAVTAAIRALLREPKKDFLLFRDAGAEKPAAEFIPVFAAEAAGAREVRAWVGSRGGDAVVAVWHCTGQEGLFELEGAPEATRIVDALGRKVPAGRTAIGAVAVPLGARRVTVVLPGTTAQSARELLRKAKFEPGKR